MANKDILLATLLCFGVFLCLVTYTLIAPLLPGELIRRDISSIYSGIIMGFYAVISFPMAVLIPKCFYPRLGYMPVYTLGIFIIAVANLSYGFCSYLPDDQKALFIGLNIGIRLFQGMGMAFVYQTCFTILSLVYVQNLGRVVALISFASTLGVAIGPTIAGVLYTFLGYIGPFLVLGSVIFLFGLLSFSLKWKPKTSPKKRSSQQFFEVKYSSFCQNNLSLVSLIAFFLRNFMTSFYEPTLAVKLQLVYGFESDESAYFYTLGTASAFISTMILTFYPIKTSSEKWTAFALAGSILTLFLMGPSALLYLPQNIYIIGIGTTLMGVFAQILTIACSVCCADTIRQLYEGQDQQISQILGSLRVSLTSVAFVVSPFYASTVQSLLSYSILCDSIAIMFTVVFIAFVWINHSHQKAKRARLNNDLTVPLLADKREK